MGINLSESEWCRKATTEVPCRTQGFSQIVALDNLTFKIRKFCFQLVHKVCHKNLTESRSKYTSRKILEQILSGICGCTTRTLTSWNLSLRCFHIHPTIFSSHSSEGSFSRWMLGNAVEKSQKVTVTYVARPLCDVFYRIIESRQYIASWIYRPSKNYASIYVSLNIKRHIYVSCMPYNLLKKIKRHIIFLIRHIFFLSFHSIFGWIVRFQTRGKVQGLLVWSSPLGKTDSYEVRKGKPRQNSNLRTERDKLGFDHIFSSSLYRQLTAYPTSGDIFKNSEQLEAKARRLLRFTEKRTTSLGFELCFELF